MKEKKPRKKRSVIFKLGKEILQKLFDENNTFSNVMKSIGYKTLSRNYNTLYRAIKYFDIDLTTFKENNRKHKSNCIKSRSSLNLTYDELLG